MAFPVFLRKLLYIFKDAFPQSSRVGIFGQLQGLVADHLLQLIAKPGMSLLTEGYK